MIVKTVKRTLAAFIIIGGFFGGYFINASVNYGVTFAFKSILLIVVMLLFAFFLAWLTE